MMEYWPNIPYLIKLPKLGAYLGRLGGLLSIETSLKPNLGGDMCQQLTGWKIMEIKIFYYYLHYNIINYYISHNKK